MHKEMRNGTTGGTVWKDVEGVEGGRREYGRQAAKSRSGHRKVIGLLQDLEVCLESPQG